MEEAICISFLIFTISVNAEESRQASDNFIVVMKHVSVHSSCDLWFHGIFEVHDFVDKTCSCGVGRMGKRSGKERGTFSQSGVAESCFRNIQKAKGYLSVLNISSESLSRKTQAQPCRSGNAVGLSADPVFPLPEPCGAGAGSGVLYQ